ncbi:MAG: hypothetical protein ACK5Q5_07945 [Planctomycetaceae bacterium]
MIRLSRAGDLRAGYFYQLAVLPADDLVDLEFVQSGKQTDEIVSLRDPHGDELFVRTGEMYLSASMNIEERDKEVFRRCPEDPSHVTEWYWRDFSVCLSGGPQSGSLIYGDDDSGRTVLVTPELAAALKSTSLRGYELKPVRIADVSREEAARWQQEKYGHIKLLELQFRGQRCYRDVLLEGTQNHCPFCGRRPLVCIGCGLENNPCAKCGKQTIVVFNKHLGEGDRRIPAQNQWNERPLIVEASRWDGSDFNFGSAHAMSLHEHVVTKRVVDWLLSIHAAPFVARPLLVNVQGASPEIVQKLEVAKRSSW